MDFLVKIEPVAKARSQTVARGGKVWAYTPTKTKEAEKELKLLLKQQITTCYPEHTPIKVTLCFYRTKPQTSKDALPVRKSDLDNYCKWAIDCLSGIAFPDDSQITSLRAIKRWSEESYPYIVIGIEEDKL